MTIKTIALLLALIHSPAALAQVTVTIQATPDSDVLGFVTGNSYSFTITLPADSRRARRGIINDDYDIPATWALSVRPGGQYLSSTP
ncbi:MAG: hypothetical protein RIS54_969 [Verrucomicrobiota bacterium]|jgi:hypothetical protein